MALRGKRLCNMNTYIMIPKTDTSSGRLIHKATLVKYLNNNLELLGLDETLKMSCDRLIRIIQGSKNASTRSAAKHRVQIGAGTQGIEEGKCAIGSDVAFKTKDAGGKVMRGAKLGRVLRMEKSFTSDKPGGKTSKIMYHNPVALTEDQPGLVLIIQEHTALDDCSRHTDNPLKYMYDGERSAICFSDVIWSGEMKEVMNSTSKEVLHWKKPESAKTIIQKHNKEVRSNKRRR